MAKTDVLLIGAHPDDVEWGAGGIVLRLAREERSFVIADLTGGEMGSRGTVEERRMEAVKAAGFAGADSRVFLDMPDGGIVDSPECRKAIASLIRLFQPTLVLAPYWEDRHPDHAATGSAVRNSALYCAMNKLDDPSPPHKPKAFLYYLLHHFQQPSFVVDISAVYEDKQKLMKLHATQFVKPEHDYLFGLESRDRYFGSLIGVSHGEALVIDKPFRLSTVSEIIDL